MTSPLFIVDAFSSRVFAGNPAAVCLLPAAEAHDCVQSDAVLQAIAAEMNLSETAFLQPRADGSWGLRWFTPQVEVDLCGHATLASAHVLWAEIGILKDTLVFHTRSGVLSARRTGVGIELDFPAVRCLAQPLTASWQQALATALNLDVADWVAHPPRQAGPDWLLPLSGPEALATLVPHWGSLAQLPIRGLIATAAGCPDGVHGMDPVDFSSRFFAPAVGINEDPVTGSAHCALACYWGERLGKTRLRGYQASARGGYVGVEWDGDRVRLQGQAVTVVAGQLREWQMR